jgi:hypothetical protein
MVRSKRALKVQMSAAFKSRQTVATKAIAGLQNNRQNTHRWNRAVSATEFFLQG